MNDAKRVFLKKGTCSQTLCFLVNREFGETRENEERASDPLAGGIMRRGRQCGMLWGSALAAGAEAFRRHPERDRAIGAAIEASRRLVESFANATGTVDCREITGCDWTRPASIAKYFLSGKLFTCLQLAAAWAPQAVRAARADAAPADGEPPRPPLSCASEVATRMGANDEQAAMVAGFAGGIGLSGHGCGALGAAIWMNTLAWCREHPGRTPPHSGTPGLERIVAAFDAATGAEMLCRNIAGRRFATIAAHAEFLREGGCAGLMQALARA